MVRHILRDGTELEDITGMVVPAEGRALQAYDLLAMLYGGREENEKSEYMEYMDGDRVV